MKRLFAFAMVILFTGCTSAEIAKWKEWFDRDPVSATEFANLPEIQARFEASNEPVNSVWDDLAWCESGGQWGYNGSSGYDGGLQFLPAVWTNYGGGDFAAYAWQATRAQQIVVAERILDDVGWQAWPACSRKLGLR